ncbi:neogenin-like isoform X2 [Centruroides sculpturatus]|uniref:neogenin-like isoform X2 n=1 Tax=Centruroides sculpturatus TaxID=218467 RepID=UPI000C6E71BE|nr:neogenin-like isoform X2 [Centruroides sculpturatus]
MKTSSTRLPAFVYWIALWTGASSSKDVKFANFHFTIEPSDNVIVKDSSAILKCSAVGSPEPVIHWKREGSVVQFDDDNRRSILPNGSLHFARIYHTRSERPDEGIYQCIATIENIGTIVSRSAKLQISSLPRFDEQPEDINVHLHQSAYLPCAIQGIPPATITWLKDGHPLNVESSRMMVLPSGALEIDFVKKSDAGIYQCNATNIEKFRLSSQGILNVNADYAERKRISAPQFIVTPKNMIAKENDTVTLECAANGDPKPKILWLKDGITIDMAHLDSRFQVVGIGSLQIENIREGDEGTYMCRAENLEDSEDASATLEVQVPPHFIEQPENKYAYEKEDIEFKCEVYGKPQPTVQWLKNGEIITQTEYFQIVNGYNLRILGLVYLDAGMYQCVATNPVDNIQASAQLIILDNDFPHPTTHATITTLHLDRTSGDQPHSKDAPSQPQDVSAVIVSTRFVTLSWREPAKANNIFAYSVYYREEGSTRERVVNTSKSRLEEVSIQGLKPSTSYFFRVVAYNQHGAGKSSEEIMVETQDEVDVPGPPLELSAQPLSATSILVQWHPPVILNGPIQQYKLYYMEVGTSEEHEVITSEPKYILQGLKKYAEYSFWVIAENQNGPGQSTDEVAATTYQDIPSDTPQNVTLEAASSTSIIVRWEPPPKESQNGIITGYKIRYKQKGSRRGETVTTDGNRRLYALTGLERGLQYYVKLSALSINGSGPSTEWIAVETYQNDLDESRVPDQPHSLRARPSSNSIFVSWAPPRNQNIMVRGYTIGWGIGFPDVYTKVLDGKQRYYAIENLIPSSEYVISLRAYNQVGDGRPIYETVKTLIETTPEPLTPMIPPVGLKAIVLSSTTVVLYWTDTTLSRNQIVTDNRYYTVRYTSYSYSANPKYRYFNSTELNCMIDNLKPNTQYEFSVKVTKGRRESTWSMNVLNTTQEAAPSSPPRDLTIFASEDDPTTINLHWQPPKFPNGQITGYVIFYTTDNTQKDRDRVVEGVVGDKMTATLKGLTADTTYYYKIQARNNKGYGPMSAEVTFRTGSDGRGLTNNMLYIIIACVSGFTLLVIVVVSAVVCRRRRGYLGPVRNKGYGSGKGTAKGKSAGKEIKPPDLWIHHDQMELKSMDKGNNGETTMTVTPIPRNSQELGDESLLDTLERKKAAYVAVAPAVPVPVPEAGPDRPHEGSSGSLTRPPYPRTQYNIPRAHVTLDAARPGTSSEAAGLPSYEQVTTSSPRQPPPAGAGPGPGQRAAYTSALIVAGAAEAAGKRAAGHPLKSFSVPAPPPQSAPATPQPKHAVKPPQSCSPHKKASAVPGAPPAPAQPSRPAAARTREAEQQDSSKDDAPPLSYSTEELNQEMANLEGLMKDLNAITASEFQC